MPNETKGKKGARKTQHRRTLPPHHDRHYGHKPHDLPYYDPDYENPPEHGHEPPDNPCYPDCRIYGEHASNNPPHWKSSEEQAFPSWLLGFTPTVNLMSGPHTVTRNIGMFSLLPDAAAVATAMANGTFNTFASALEGIHNSGHVWVRGSMGSVPAAPCDPVFWMHHCEIDRLWAEWQAANPGQNPALAGAAATIDPWTETEVDTRDITALGYSYA